MGDFVTPRRVASPRVAGEFSATWETLPGRFNPWLVPVRKRSERCIVRLSVCGALIVNPDMTRLFAGGSITPGDTVGVGSGAGRGVGSVTGSNMPSTGVGVSSGFATPGAGFSGCVGSIGDGVGRVSDGVELAPLSRLRLSYEVSLDECFRFPKADELVLALALVVAVLTGSTYVFGSYLPAVAVCRPLCVRWVDP